MGTGEYIHFRCSSHVIDGHFERRPHVFPAKCEVIGCKNQGFAFWYRGEKFATLPQPQPRWNG